MTPTRTQTPRNVMSIPPSSIKATVDAIATARKVTLYKETK